MNEKYIRECEAQINHAVRAIMFEVRKVIPDADYVSVEAEFNDNLVGDREPVELKLYVMPTSGGQGAFINGSDMVEKINKLKTYAKKI